MRLRLMSGATEVTVLECTCAEELADVLAHLQETVGVPPLKADALHVHLWHHGAWWSLSDDLSQFFAWSMETGAATLGEVRAFAAAPLSRPAWLFEAAQQMKTLLRYASASSQCGQGR